MELSGSSGTIRSGSTLTGYDFDTVKNLNLDSCSTSKMSLSLKSEGFDDFTLTPDEPKIPRNCDLEDFTLTPEASYSEAPVGASTTDDADTDLNLGEANRADSIFESSTKNDDGSISSNEVLVIVDKFLTNERLLQQNLNIVPIPITSKSFTSPLVSPIDSDASSTNVLLEKQKGTLFNLQSSSSKSTLDDALDLEKINFDEEFDGDCDANEIEAKNREMSTLTTEITREFDLLFSRAKIDIVRQSKTPFELKNNGTHNLESSSNDQTNENQIRIESTSSSKSTISPSPLRMPTRYSMQKLEPYYFPDDVTGGNENAPTEATTLLPVTSTGTDITPTITTQQQQKNDYCKALDANDGSFLQRKIISKLKKNKSQSLGNLNRKSRCFPL